MLAMQKMNQLGFGFCLCQHLKPHQMDIALFNPQRMNVEDSLSQLVLALQFCVGSGIVIHPLYFDDFRKFLKFRDCIFERLTESKKSWKYAATGKP